MAGVPRGGLDDRATGTQKSAPLGILDHLEPDTVLNTAARVEGFYLGQDGGAKSRRHSMEPHQRRVPDGLQDIAQDLHCATFYA